MTYPLPTLACTISSTGITAPAFQDILNSLIASFQGIYGSDVYLAPDSQDYQWLAILATAQNDSNNATIAAYNSYRPSYAQGAGLSSVVKINGITRQTGSNSTAILTIGGVGSPETVIPAGVVQDENGYLWDLPVNTTIGPSGTVTVVATCETAGSIAAPAGTINVIYTQVLGWQTVTNASSATLGTAVETDGALRQRQAISVSLTAQTPLEAIISTVANIPGVSRYAIYENQTAVTDGNGVPSHSIAVVAGGSATATAIAQAIESKKSPGTGTYGTTSVIVQDPAGVPITIDFFVLTNVEIFVGLTIQPLNGFVNSTVATIQTAIAALINGLAIGEEVYLNWLYGPASLYGSGLEFTFAITSLTIGLSSGSLGTANIPITFNSAAFTVAATDIAVTVL